MHTYGLRSIHARFTDKVLHEYGINSLEESDYYSGDRTSKKLGASSLQLMFILPNVRPLGVL